MSVPGSGCAPSGGAASGGCGAKAGRPERNRKVAKQKGGGVGNLVGATGTYLDGALAHNGDKTGSHATGSVSVRDSLSQVVQADDVPLRILQTSGPYPEAVDLRVAPLAPAQGKPFRLIFEHVTADWNHEYPELRVTEVAAK